MGTPDLETAPLGVMEAAYARGRRETPHLSWRYRARAFEAVKAFTESGLHAGDVSVLELGAADGLTLLEMRSLLGGRGTFHGVELSDSLLAEAPPLPDNVQLMKGDVTSLPQVLSPGSYHLVTALAVLEHLKDPAACVREAHRALLPGGMLVATCPNPFWDEVAGRLRLVADEHHAQQLTGAVMKRLFEEQGFLRVAYRPFMWAPIAVLPYFRLGVAVEWAHRIETVVRHFPLTGPFFVNQMVVGTRPR